MFGMYKICNAVLELRHNTQLLDLWLVDTAVVAIMNHCNAWDINKRRLNHAVLNGSLVGIDSVNGIGCFAIVVK